MEPLLQFKGLVHTFSTPSEHITYMPIKLKGLMVAVVALVLLAAKKSLKTLQCMKWRMKSSLRLV